MIILSIITIILVVGLVLGFIIILSFSKPHKRHSSTPKDEGIKFEEVSIPTKNNKRLFGWWLKAEEKAPTIILMHGWGRNAGRLIPYIKNLQDNGFNLLAFDTRHHGNSDHDKFSSMVKFAQDISASIDFIEADPITEKDNVFLIGLSIGGAASIYAAAADSRIKKIITIGAPSNPADVMTMHIRKKHIPKPIIWLAFKVMEKRIGSSFKELSTCNNVFKTRAKVLLIHGTKDKVVPFSQSKLILNAANNGQAKLWAIEGKGHSNCHYENGFWDRVINFLSSNENTTLNNQE